MSPAPNAAVLQETYISQPSALHTPPGVALLGIHPPGSSTAPVLMSAYSLLTSRFQGVSDNRQYQENIQRWYNEHDTDNTDQ